MRCLLQAVNPKKAAGPEDISESVLRSCAELLAGVFTKIFNLSLSQVTVPPCLKSSTIDPLPVSSLNDYQLVAVTPVVMKP